MLLNALAILLVTPQCGPLPAKPACADALAVWADGCPRRWVCPADMAAESLTRIDLSDAWLPRIFRAGSPEDQPYRSVYRKLAAGQIDDDEVEGRAERDQFFETYGIFPNLTVVRDRLLQAERHACRDAVDDTELAAYDRVISAYEKTDKQRKRIRAANGLERRFRKVLVQRASDTIKAAAKARAKAIAAAKAAAKTAQKAAVKAKARAERAAQAAQKAAATAAAVKAKGQAASTPIKQAASAKAFAASAAAAQVTADKAAAAQAQAQEAVAAAAAAKAAADELVAQAPPETPVPTADDFTLADIEALGEEKRWRWSVGKWKRSYPQVEAVRAAQEHLVCEGMMSKVAYPGLFDHRVFIPLQAFQRKMMLGARSHLDAETRDSFVLDSRVADYRALMRGLRERVRAASGLIEDGSALGKWGTVFGQQLDTEEYRHPLPGVPMGNGAPDYLSPATEAAAKALGWTSAEAAIARLATMTDLKDLAIAVALPPPPPWHSPHMPLRAEIDRGDVWYDYPVTPEGKPRYQPIERRAHITLYTRHGDAEVALVRWPTTIGSWKKEVLEDGTTAYKYKNSDVGERVWRTLVAGPSWLPPKSTPNEDLVERRHGRYRAKRDIFGPSYASAFGLVMLIHNKPVQRGDETKYYDFGIRVHGSVSYRSIVRGTSHGCHRLFNHLAVRLGDFVLRHRKHTIEGPIPTSYGRTFTHKGHTIQVRIPSRGFGYTLDPPVPVNVLRGRVRGRTRRAPKEAQPVPE